jgi:hypothetical protein
VNALAAISHSSPKTAADVMIAATDAPYLARRRQPSSWAGSDSAISQTRRRRSKLSRRLVLPSGMRRGRGGLGSVSEIAFSSGLHLYCRASSKS